MPEEVWNSASVESSRVLVTFAHYTPPHSFMVCRFMAAVSKFSQFAITPLLVQCEISRKKEILQAHLLQQWLSIMVPWLNSVISLE